MNIVIRTPNGFEKSTILDVYKTLCPKSVFTYKYTIELLKALYHKNNLKSNA